MKLRKRWVAALAVAAAPLLAIAPAASARQAPFLAAGAVTHHAPGCYRDSTSARVAANRQGWTCSVNGHVAVPLSGNPFLLHNFDTGRNVESPPGNPLGTQYNMGSGGATTFLRINYYDEHTNNGDVGFYEYVDTANGTCPKEDPNLSHKPMVVWTCISGTGSVGAEELTRNFYGRYNSQYISLESYYDFNSPSPYYVWQDDFGHLDHNCSTEYCQYFEWQFL